MAQVPATSYESTSLGDVAEFTIPFPFLSRAEVFVTVDDAPVAFTWINDGLVQLAEIPELGAVVRRYRSTAAYVPLHQFSQGVPFLPRYVDRDFKQTLYAVQESVNDTAGTSALALDTAELALDTAQDALALVGERTQYMVLGPYGPGLHFQTTSQVFSYLGEFYAPGPGITLPYITTGVGAAEIATFRGVGDATLRADLVDPASVSKGAALVARAEQVVGSIAAIRLLLKTSASVAAFVTGYYDQGDGGGGAYYLDAADVVSADNGGTVIVAADGGRWKLAHTGVLSVKQFGAKGDNTNDDSIPSQACIDAVKALGGGTVIFPTGTYNFQSKRPAGLTPRAFEDPNLFVNDADNLHIVGIGESILTNSAYPNNRAEIILFYRSSHCSVRGITFQGNNTGMPVEVNNAGIGMLSNKHLTIRDNVFQGFQGSYIASSWLFNSLVENNTFTVGAGSGIDCAFWQDVKVIGNRFYGNGTGTNGLGSQGMQCIHDTPNEGNNESGVFFRFATNHVTIKDNQFENFITGLFLGDMYSALVGGNNFHNNYLNVDNQSWGCVITNTNASDPLFPMTGMRFTNNTFSNNGSPVSGGGLTISLGTSSLVEAELDGNAFYDNSKIGLLVGAGVTLRGGSNTFRNAYTNAQITNVSGLLGAASGSLFINNPGVNPAAAIGPAIPAGLGFANAVTHSRPYPATVYQNGGVGIHIVMPSGTDVTLFPGDSKVVRLPAYAKIYFATTNTTGWTWVFEQ